ncbi:hypothetical protein [Streptomyces sp. NBC_01244]|uniref:hypothetical protein n=1 Tax=Streptomyces sp. NBC_01244 TaxID=2903797 RepID=UPI002E12B90B|nr:hypothetical protein OG247_44480 [Streptomyces sp. NBC_01244]
MDTRPHFTMTAEQHRRLAELTVQVRQAIADAPASAYEHWQLLPELQGAFALADWERAVFHNRLQDLLLAVETTLGLPPQNLPRTSFAPRG